MMGASMKHLLHSKKGTASVEAITMLVLFVMILGYCMGVFGVIHTGILNSIHARALAFETFRNRADLTYWRDMPYIGTAAPGQGSPLVVQYKSYGFRAHGVNSEIESSGKIEFKATTRNLTRDTTAEALANGGDHAAAEKIGEGRNQKAATNPVWIKTLYGICLNSQCGR